MNGLWFRGFVKLDTRELGSSSPSLVYTPDLRLCLRPEGEESRDMETVSRESRDCDNVSRARDSGGNDIPLLRD